jgi:hypothetical protein
MLGGEPDGHAENSKLLPSEYIPMGIAALCVLSFGARIPYVFDLVLRQAMAVLR